MATILSVVFRPLYSRSRSVLRSDGLAAFAATLMVVVCVILPLTLALWVAVGELREAYRHVRNWNPDRAAEWISARSGVPVEEMRHWAVSEMGQYATRILSVGRTLVTGAGSTIFQWIIAFVTLFFLFRDGTRIRDAIISYSPLRQVQIRLLLSQLHDSIMASMLGVIAVGAAQGVLTGIALWAFGIPSPVLWSIVTAALSLIPLFGSGLVWGPAALMLVLQGSWGKGLLLAVWGAAVVAQVDNIVRPWVVSGRAGSNPLLVLFGLLGGVQAFGISGIFLGPAIVSTTATLLGFLAQSLGPLEGGQGEK